MHLENALKRLSGLWDTAHLCEKSKTRYWAHGDNILNLCLAAAISSFHRSVNIVVLNEY